MTTNGYIYIFTVDHSNAHIKNTRSKQFEPLESNADANSCSCFPFRSNVNKGRLIKVGYTGKTPQIRLSEWKTKCKHHSFELLVPDKPVIGPARYDYSKKGWPTRDVKTVEILILSSLRKKYGRGHLECHGCNGNHVEWFLLPSDKHLVKVYKNIEQCLR